MQKYISIIAIALGVCWVTGGLGLPTAFAQSEEGSVTGELKRWHPVTVTFDGPEASETGAFNPFTGYRLNVTFRHESGEEAYVVPGYFAADGNAAETGATSGNKWRVHFTPGRTGAWTYTASFRRGEGVATNLRPAAGEGTSFDGARGSFTIAETDKTGRDHRGKGMLRYVGEHHLHFDNGEWFMKGGPDSPETLLGYEDFDGTYTQTDEISHSYGDILLWGSWQHWDRRGSVPLKTYDAHVQDWNPGDPTWQGEKGKGLIGALNYLAEEGMNAFSFLTLNAGGDAKNVWPWISHAEMDRYDVSKLAQWEIVFTHADSLGLFKHFKTHETEVDQLLDGGMLGPNRMLYWRELIARFAHHHALNWNLGEEHDTVLELNDPDQEHVKADMKYIHDLDPYDHPVVIHSYPGLYDEVYNPLLGYEYFEGPSVQTSSMRPWRNFSAILRFVEDSDEAGRKWNVSLDEAGSGTHGVSTDDYDENYNLDEARASYWATIAAGGDGVEWFFGDWEPQSDLVAEDFRSRDLLWDYTRHAMQFYRDNDVPFWEMQNANRLTHSEKDFVFAIPGEVYVIYLPDGGPATLNLQEHAGTFRIDWYDPRAGGSLQRGAVFEPVEETYSREPAHIMWRVPEFTQPRLEGGRVVDVSGPGRVSLGQPPEDIREDWVVLVRRR